MAHESEDQVRTDPLTTSRSYMHLQMHARMRSVQPPESEELIGTAPHTTSLSLATGHELCWRI